MVAVPTAPAVIVPEDPILATAVLLLLHVPPDGVQFNVVVVPWHNEVEPVMDPGDELTVIVVVYTVPPPLQPELVTVSE